MVSIYSHYGDAMEQLILEVEAFARTTSRTPEMVLRDALGAGWGQWGKWVAGKASPTMKNVDRLRAYMDAQRKTAVSEV